MKLRLCCLLLLLAVTATAQTVKIATYNIYFLDDGISQERKANLQTVIDLLDADIVACQEINNSAAMQNIFGEAYQIAMVDDPNEVQELALAVRKPFRILSTKHIHTETYYDYEFPRSRNLLQVTVEGHGREWIFLVHHAKSRRGGREANDYFRVGATRLINSYLKSPAMTGKNVVVLGDFNDNPDDRSLNVLEYGDFWALGGIDKVPDSFLYNTTEQLLEQDIGSYGYNYLLDSIQTETFNPVVPGSRAENNRWRGITHDFMKDVKIKITLLDQILVSMNLKPHVREVGVFNHASAVRGINSRIKFEEDKLVYVRRGAFASDHLPVWVTLQF